MLDSIYIGMSGLMSYSKGLQVIANNTANIDTPGFKSSSTQFADLMGANGNSSGNSYAQSSDSGSGVAVAGSTLSFTQGQFSQTSNDLDLAINGNGMFVLKDTNGNILYTRDGQFQFNSAGLLVTKADGNMVMGLDSSGNLAEITNTGLNVNSGSATSTVTLTGNLSSSATSDTISSLAVYDAAGGKHTLTMQFTSTSSTTAGSWQVQLLDGTTAIGTGQLVFQNGTPTTSSAKISMTYTPSGQAAIPLTLDFSSNVTSTDSGTTSSLAVASQNGYASGSLTKTTFDSTGTLVLTYSNGQTVKGKQLALGSFDSTDAVVSIGSNEFKSTNPAAWIVGVAGSGAFGSIAADQFENSNVNLSTEFSNLVIMQRGYQGSSEVISTANDMLQDLFSMKSK